MYVNPTTLLFHDLDDETAEDMEAVADAISLKGELPHPRPPWLEEWIRTADLDDRQYLVMVSTVLPMKVYCSLLRRTRETTR